jgi:hypothetical protein
MGFRTLAQPLLKLAAARFKRVSKDVELRNGWDRPALAAVLYSIGMTSSLLALACETSSLLVLPLRFNEPVPRDLAFSFASFAVVASTFGLLLSVRTPARRPAVRAARWAWFVLALDLLGLGELPGLPTRRLLGGLPLLGIKFAIGLCAGVILLIFAPRLYKMGECSLRKWTNMINDIRSNSK